MKTSITGLILLIVLTTGLCVPSWAYNFYVWDNDAGAGYEIEDPETHQMVGCEFAIERALTQNGYGFDSGLNFPTDPGLYDVIFIAMGYYC